MKVDMGYEWLIIFYVSFLFYMKMTTHDLPAYYVPNNVSQKLNFSFLWSDVKNHKKNTHTEKWYKGQITWK